MFIFFGFAINTSTLFSVFSNHPPPTPKAHVFYLYFYYLHYNKHPYSFFFFFSLSLFKQITLSEDALSYRLACEVQKRQHLAIHASHSHSNDHFKSCTSPVLEARETSLIDSSILRQGTRVALGRPFWPPEPRSPGIFSGDKTLLISLQN